MNITRAIAHMEHGRYCRRKAWGENGGRVYLSDVEYNRTAAMRRKASIKRLTLFKQGRRRALYGGKRKTKLRISLLPLKVRKNKYALCYKYGYFTDGNPSSTVLYYDSQTRRNARSEEYSKRVYGITFEQGDE